MGCRIIKDKKIACFYCSTSGVVFGPVIDADVIEEFQSWLGEDPRTCMDLEDQYNKFIAIRELECPCENCGEQEQQGYEIGDKEVCLDCYSGVGDDAEIKVGKR